MDKAKQRVVVLGASDQPEKYAGKAVSMLLAAGHEVLPVNPNLAVIGQLHVYKALDEITGRVDTLTLYVSPKVSSQLQAQIIKLKPGRVIFNPQTENAELAATLDEQGIANEQACTLVLLRTNQF